MSKLVPIRFSDDDIFGGWPPAPDHDMPGVLKPASSTGPKEQALLSAAFEAAKGGDAWRHEHSDLADHLEDIGHPDIANLIRRRYHVKISPQYEGYSPKQRATTRMPHGWYQHGSGDILTFSTKGGSHQLTYWIKKPDSDHDDRRTGPPLVPDTVAPPTPSDVEPRGRTHEETASRQHQLLRRSGEPVRMMDDEEAFVRGIHDSMEKTGIRTPMHDYVVHARHGDLTPHLGFADFQSEYDRPALAHVIGSIGSPQPIDSTTARSGTSPQQPMLNGTPWEVLPHTMTLNGTTPLGRHTITIVHTLNNPATHPEYPKGIRSRTLEYHHTTNNTELHRKLLRHLAHELPLSAGNLDDIGSELGFMGDHSLSDSLNQGRGVPNPGNFHEMGPQQMQRRSLRDRFQVKMRKRGVLRFADNESMSNEEPLLRNVFDSMAPHLRGQSAAHTTDPEMGIFPHLVLSDHLEGTGRPAMAAMIRHIVTHRGEPLTHAAYVPPNSHDLEMQYRSGWHFAYPIRNGDLARLTYISPNQHRVMWFAPVSRSGVRPEDVEREVGHPTRETFRRGQPLRFKVDPIQNTAGALGQAKSSNQNARAQTISRLLTQMGLTPHTVMPCLHDTVSEVKPSVAAAIHKAPEQGDALQYASAWSGLLGGIPSLLAFTSAPQGPDSLYHMHLSGSGEQIHQAMNQAGIGSRTLIPGKTGFEVLIHDAGRQQRAQVSQFAKSVNAKVGESQGTGQVVGSDDAADGRAAQRKIIRSVEGGRQQMQRIGMVVRMAAVPINKIHHDFFVDTTNPMFAHRNKGELLGTASVLQKLVSEKGEHAKLAAKVLRKGRYDREGRDAELELEEMLAKMKHPLNRNFRDEFGYDNEEVPELQPGQETEDGGKYEPEQEPNLGTFIFNQYAPTYGTSDAINQGTGYLLRNGTAVQMGPPNQRAEDHRGAIPTGEAMQRWGWPEEVVRRYNEGTRGSAMVELMRRSQAARIHRDRNLLSIHTEAPLTRAQKEQIHFHVAMTRPETVIFEHMGNGHEMSNPSADDVQEHMDRMDNMQPKKYQQRGTPIRMMFGQLLAPLQPPPIFRGESHPFVQGIPGLQDNFSHISTTAFRHIDNHNNNLTSLRSIHQDNLNNGMPELEANRQHQSRQERLRPEAKMASVHHGVIQQVNAARAGQFAQPFTVAGVNHSGPFSALSHSMHLLGNAPASNYFKGIHNKLTSQSAAAPKSTAEQMQKLSLRHRFSEKFKQRPIRMSKSELEGLWNNAVMKPYEQTPHLILADKLEEMGSPLAPYLRRAIEPPDEDEEGGNMWYPATDNSTFNPEMVGDGPTDFRDLGTTPEGLRLHAGWALHPEHDSGNNRITLIASASHRTRLPFRYAIELRPHEAHELAGQLGSAPLAELAAMAPQRPAQE